MLFFIFNKNLKKIEKSLKYKIFERFLFKQLKTLNMIPNPLCKRNFFWMLLILLSSKSFSQKSFIITNDNEKIIVDDNSIDVDIQGERVSYKSPNSDKETEIKFKKIKTANIGDYRMNRMKIADEKDEQLFFTIAETSEKKLIGYSSETSLDVYSPHNAAKQVQHNGNASYGYETKTTIKYSYYVIDNNNNKTIEKLKCIDTYGEKFAEEINKVEETIKKHFPDCKEITDRLISSYDSNNADVKHSKMVEKMINRMSEGNFNIILFFECLTSALFES